MKSNVIAYMLSVIDLYPWSVCLCGNNKFAGLNVQVGGDSMQFLFTQDEVAAIQEAYVEADAAGRPYIHGASYVVSRLLDAFNPYGAE